MAQKLANLNYTNRSYERLPFLFYDVKPTPLISPRLIHLNQQLVQDLELDIAQTQTPSFLRFLNGDLEFEGIRYTASIYSGHQFGAYNPQLGDGRAILLGEVKVGEGLFYEWQLKGAGLTPFSRMGDGKAVYRSSVREYLASAHLKALGVPTTEALALIKGEDDVQRERVEKAAIVLRTAESFLRFGHYEFLYHQKRYEELNELVDFTIASYYPTYQDHPNKYVLFYQEVIKKTARLFAQWQSIGFCHGVLNTDNTSILGLTIDYGPYGFIENFDQDFICNSSDYEGRYSLGNQPGIGMWNLEKLGIALSPLISLEDKQRTLESSPAIFLFEYRKFLLEKLGLYKWSAEDEKLLKEMLNMLVETRIDYTSFFRRLSSYCQGSLNSSLFDSLGEGHPRFSEWLTAYDQRLKLEEVGEEDRQEKMRMVNPKFILRNYLAQMAIESEEVLNDLYQVLSNPYEEWEAFSSWAKPTPESLRRVKVSCSS